LRDYIACDTLGDRCDEVDVARLNEIDRWKSRRTSLIQDKIRLEVESRLQRQSGSRSTQLLRLSVRSAHGGQNDPNGLLTIWKPSEEQLEHLKVGVTVRLVNVAVKNVMLDRQLQLSVSGKNIVASTPKMTHLTSSSNCILSNWLLSKRLDFTKTVYSTLGRIDVQGAVLNFVQHSGRDMIYLSDDSFLVLRLDLAESTQKSIVFKRNFLTSIGRSLSFKNLLLKPFDRLENCAVALFDGNSNYSFVQNDDFVGKCNGSTMLRSLLTATAFPKYMSACDSNPVVVGWLSRVESIANDHVYVRVDSGNMILRTLKVDLSLLFDLLALHEEKDASTCFLQREKTDTSTPEQLDRFFRSSGYRYRFQLRKLEHRKLELPSCIYEIAEIRKLDTLSLAQHYICLLRTSDTSVSRLSYSRCNLNYR
jgi:hypothetical protein